jgi:hypothetical protein
MPIDYEDISSDEYSSESEDELPAPAPNRVIMNLQLINIRAAYGLPSNYDPNKNYRQNNVKKADIPNGSNHVIRWHDAGVLTDIGDLPRLRKAVMENAPKKDRLPDGTLSIKSQRDYLGLIRTFVNKPENRPFLKAIGLTDVQCNSVYQKLLTYINRLEKEGDAGNVDKNHRQRQQLSTSEARRFDLETFRKTRPLVWKSYHALAEMYDIDVVAKKDIQALQSNIALVTYYDAPNIRSAFCIVKHRNIDVEKDNFIRFNGQNTTALVFFNKQKVSDYAPTWFNLNEDLTKVYRRFIDTFRKDSDYVFLNAKGDPYELELEDEDEEEVIVNDNKHTFTNTISKFIKDRGFGNFTVKDLRVMQASLEKELLSPEESKKRAMESGQSAPQRENYKRFKTCDGVAGSGSN